MCWRYKEMCYNRKNNTTSRSMICDFLKKLEFPRKWKYENFDFFKKRIGRSTGLASHSTSHSCGNLIDGLPHCHLLLSRRVMTRGVEVFFPLLELWIVERRLPCLESSSEPRSIGSARHPRTFVNFVSDFTLQCQRQIHRVSLNWKISEMRFSIFF